MLDRFKKLESISLVIFVPYYFYKILIFLANFIEIRLLDGVPELRFQNSLREAILEGNYTETVYLVHSFQGCVPGTQTKGIRDGTLYHHGYPWFTLYNINTSRTDCLIGV